MTVFDDMMAVGMDVLLSFRGQSATYTNPAGTGTAVSVMMQPVSITEEDGSSRTDPNKATIIGQTATISKNGTFTIDSNTWSIDVVHNYGPRFRATCVRRMVAEVSRPGYRRE